MADHTHIEHSRNTVHNSRLDAKGNITIGDGNQYITNLYLNADYEQMMQREAELQEMLDFYQAKGDAQQALRKSGELNEHRKRIEQFKSDVLQLAATFASIPITTERLKQASALFEQGKFKEADTLLSYADLKGDQDRLLTIKAENEEALATNANEFLIKAQATALDYENPHRFEDSCRYFEASIQSQENPDNLFAYAYFLQEHQQNKEAQSYYECYLELFRAKLSQVQLAAVLNNLGNLHSARSEYLQAEKSLEEALEIRRKLAEANPQTYLPAVAHTLNNLGVFHRTCNEFTEAERSYQESLEIRRKLAQVNPQSYLRFVVDTLNNLGLLQSAQNEYSKAEESCSEALEIYQNLAQVDPQTYLPYVATGLNNLGVLYWQANEYSQAEGSYQKALEIRRKLAQDNPQIHLPDVATTLNNLGVLLQTCNKYSEAESNYQEALELRRKLTQFDSQTYLRSLAETLNNLGSLQFRRSDFPHARNSLQEALQIRKELAQANPHVYLPDVAATLINLGALHRKLDEYAQAETSYQEALKIQRDLAHTNPQTYLPEVGKSLNNLGNVQSDRKKYAQAKESFQEALIMQGKLAEVIPKIHLPEVATTLINWASLNQKLGNRDSLGQIREGLKILAPFVSRMPFAQEVVKAAFGVLLAWEISPIDFVQGKNLPPDLLIFTSSSSGSPS